MVDITDIKMILYTEKSLELQEKNSAATIRSSDGV